MPRGLSALADATVTSVPVVTTAAKGLFEGGRVLNRIGNAGLEMLGESPNYSRSIANPFMQKTDPPIKGVKMLESNIPINAGPSPSYMDGAIQSRDSVIPPAPPVRLRLPGEAVGGETHPMIGIKAPSYPDLATDYARTRVSPTVFNGPPTNPFDVPRGLLNADNPKTTKPKKSVR
jgi:hypothetical protein